jgi:tetratricopeptide (TPR) repeat protein
MTTLVTRRGLIAALLGLGLSAAGAAARGSAPEGHREELARLDAYLAAGDSAAAAALVQRVQPELDRDERFALDTIYCLIGRRAFPEARDQWNRVGRRIQEGVRTTSGQKLGPAAEKDLKRRVAEAWFVQGLLTARFGEKAEALRLLRDSDGYGFPPLDSPLMLLAADCLYDLQEYDLASQAYGEVLKRSPQNADARLRLGASFLSSGQVRAAEKELDEVLRQSPRQPLADYFLGAALLEEKRTDESKAHLERGLALDPRCFACMAKLAHIAYLKGDDGECQSWLAKATALSPDDPETNLVEGMLEIRKGHYDLAVKQLARVVAQAPGHISARYQLALAYQRAGDVEKAREQREVYDRLIQEQKARTLGVRGAQ